ncbi:MAG: hypothetical protein E7477_00185 [Ruminococcaceae bacterium]|nr:hypothetical protein [Oscillospiraceae bacterium]
MKKILSIFTIILLISVCLAACEQSEKTLPEQTPEQTEITLTKDNIRKYLIISGQYGKIERQQKIGITFGYSDFTINIDPAVPGSFYNASITLQVALTKEWDVSSSDPAYSENDGYLTTTIKIPAHGSKEETHSLIANIVFGDHNNQNVRINVLSVSGTFVPAN